MINVYYRYSEFDKKHEYGVKSSYGYGIFYSWIWFYLAKTKLCKMKGKIWFVPFGFQKEGIIKSYQEVHSAEKIAGWISNIIIKDFNRRKA